MAITEEQRERSRQYKETAPASVCVCGHTGDGARSQHLNSGPQEAIWGAGHGACIVPSCSCLKFRWDRFRIPYTEFLGVK